MTDDEQATADVDELGRPLTTVALLTRLARNEHGGSISSLQAGRVLRYITKTTGDKATLRLKLNDAEKRQRAERDLHARLVAEAIERQTAAEQEAHRAQWRLSKSATGDVWRLVDRLLDAHMSPLHVDEWVALIEDLAELVKRRQP